MMTPSIIVGRTPATSFNASAEMVSSAKGSEVLFRITSTRDRIAIVHKWADGAGHDTPLPDAGMTFAAGAHPR